MAKQYKIVLSEAKEQRDVEAIMLQQSFEIAAAREKDYRKRNCILDCVEQIENVSDKRELLFTKDDLDQLKKGQDHIASAPNGMPLGWLRGARSVLRQLENPDEASETD